MTTAAAAAAPPALEIRNLQKRFGALQVANNISLALPRGARHALIGPNGAGKTTLINLITGRVRVLSRALSRRQISSPDTPGSIQSRMIRSGGFSARRSSASSPRSTLSTLYPSASRL